MRKLGVFVAVFFLTSCGQVKFEKNSVHPVVVTTPPARLASPSGACKPSFNPDASCTPGALNPGVTQANIATTVCKGGWTATIRPSVAVSSALKRQAAKMYGIANFNPTQFEGDHNIPLELGGAPNDIKNFWDEPHNIVGFDGKPAGSFEKDAFENYLNFRVCRAKARMRLADAQQIIADDWYGAYVAAGRPADPYKHHP